MGSLITGVSIRNRIITEWNGTIKKEAFQIPTKSFYKSLKNQTLRHWCHLDGNSIHFLKSHRMKKWGYVSSSFVVCKSSRNRWRKAPSSFYFHRLPGAQDWNALQTDVSGRCLEHFSFHGPLWERKKRIELYDILFNRIPWEHFKASFHFRGRKRE